MQIRSGGERENTTPATRGSRVATRIGAGLLAVTAFGLVGCAQRSDSHPNPTAVNCPGLFTDSYAVGSQNNMNRLLDGDPTAWQAVKAELDWMAAQRAKGTGKFSVHVSIAHDSYEPKPSAAAAQQEAGRLAAEASKELHIPEGPDNKTYDGQNGLGMIYRNESGADSNPAC